MTSIITYLLFIIQYQYKQICWLLLFIAKFIPLKQWAYDDTHSPKYQKFKVDKLPIIIKFEKQDYRFLLEYYKYKYSKPLKPVNRRNGKSIPNDIICPRCGAPHSYMYDNNGGNGQYLCKVCSFTFNINHHADNLIVFKCPYCNSTLVPIKSREDFRIHKCKNNSCSYYRSELNKINHLPKEERYKYKLHYIFREPTKEFFKMDLSSFPPWGTQFKYKAKNAYIMGLCLTYHVNLGLSLRKTSQALKDIHNINISHTMVANYAKTAAVVVKPFVDHFDYNPSMSLAADETYIKVRGIKGYVWFIMDAISRSILGYTVSNSRSVKPCILTMRMAFNKFKQFPKKALTFVADGYSAYPLARNFFLQNNPNNDFDITTVIGLTNDDEVSTEYRPFKQKIERLNRTFKATYRVTCGYGSDDGATYGVSLWVAYYNFLRPHKLHNWKRPLNIVDDLVNADNMPAKWQLLIYLGQQQLLRMQQSIT